MNTKEMLKTLCCVDGNSGSEKLAAELSKDILSAYGKTHIDNLGSVICEVAPKKNGRMVMLDAHLDQIALIVINIEENGFLRTYPCGGIDRRGIFGTKVRVLGKDGEYLGIVCSVPPHIKDVNEKNPERDEIFVDIGFNKEETEKRVRLGDRVMMCGRWSDIGNGYVTGPALDDRSGCVTILEALEILKGKELPCGLTAVFSTREETGGQGAGAAAFAVAPTEAIEIDVGFGKTPDTTEINSKAMKKGPVVAFHPTLDLEISRRLIALAKKNEIPFQVEAYGGTSTGTNADDITSAGAGVRTGLISIPQQYMHSIIEKVSVDDVKNVGRLLAAFVMEGGEEQ
ncbi:MAG: M20/M25/M40 family metallo-hydrolase [Oscillospiraceae bacterium]|nr:M20/M25/M40 family metallo-hydrolase [Oscillospiraceae bacterium]